LNTYPGNGSAPSESERTVTLLTAAECRDKAEQKMAEAANNPALHLATRNAVGALPLRWTILTAARTGDVLGDPDIDPLGATWKEISEIDGAPVWIISAERMKMQFRHVVPLTPEMLALLGPRGADDERLFGQPQKTLSDENMQPKCGLMSSRKISALTHASDPRCFGRTSPLASQSTATIIPRRAIARPSRGELDGSATWHFFRLDFHKRRFCVRGVGRMVSLQVSSHTSDR
jgi:hypothetical protein